MIQSVTISEEAYKQMFRYVIEYANPIRPYRQWREVIGWLVGKIEQQTVYIQKAIPMTSGNSIFVEMTDYTIIPQIAEEAEKIGAIIVGWFHSHPSFGFFLSGVDIRTQRNQQSLFTDAIAIVCDPTKVTNQEPGMHGYQVYMDPSRKRDYRELEIQIETTRPFPTILQQLLAEKGIEKSYAEVIAHKDLSALYALEGISPPQPIRPDIDAFLITERQAIPELEGTYQLPYSFIHKKPTFIQLRISNIGEGIAFNVECRFIPNSSIKLHSMYSHRIIDQLTYQSTIIETFKVEPLKKGKIQFPATTITYQSFDRQQYQKIVPSKDILVQ